VQLWLGRDISVTPTPGTVVITKIFTRNYQIISQKFFQVGDATGFKSSHLHLASSQERNCLMIEEPLDMQLTSHATARCSQRGVKRHVIELILRLGDIEIPAQLGRTQVQLSRIAISMMLAEGISVSDADDAKNVALIVDADGLVITVLRLGPKDRRILGKRHSCGRNGRRRRR
jgi:hypothetical protein